MTKEFDNMMSVIEWVKSHTGYNELPSSVTDILEDAKTCRIITDTPRGFSYYRAGKVVLRADDSGYYNGQGDFICPLPEIVRGRIMVRKLKEKMTRPT